MADGGGGSHGGTNLNGTSGELVDFEKVGKRVRIDPRTFEGIYSEIAPRIRMIEEKIPGLGKELESVFDERSWFMTDREFEPRRSGEDKPIDQDNEHVLLTYQKVKNMSRERLRRAWFHEAVRRVVEGGSWSRRNNNFMDRLAIDDLVEKLTVALYEESDRPATLLAQLLNNAIGTDVKYYNKNDDRNSGFLGFLSRPEIYERIRSFHTKEKLQSLCGSKTAPNIQACIPDVRQAGYVSENYGSFFQKIGSCLPDSERKRILSSLNEMRVSFPADTENYIGFRRITTQSQFREYAINFSGYESGQNSERFENRTARNLDHFLSWVNSAIKYTSGNNLALNNEPIGWMAWKCATLSESSRELVNEAYAYKGESKSNAAEAVRSFAELETALKGSTPNDSRVVNNAGDKASQGIIANEGSHDKDLPSRLGAFK
jgi:hypothetical protein